MPLRICCMSLCLQDHSLTRLGGSKEQLMPVLQHHINCSYGSVLNSTAPILLHARACRTSAAPCWVPFSLTAVNPCYCAALLLLCCCAAV
jgi:hypothetical protein